MSTIALLFSAHRWRAPARSTMRTRRIRLQYSHRQGLIFAQESGWCRDVFPQDGTLVPDHIREEYGTIIIVHKYIKVGDERSDDIEQEFLFVSGIGHR